MVYIRQRSLLGVSDMLNYWVSIIFLALLLVPIGWFFIALISLTADDVNKNKRRSSAKQSEYRKSKTEKKRLRIVK